ncbi:MAG: precorrin-3B C(17)-methyltransferase [Clostridia bacterium]|nr:precorrin-3B C(17)-methyltransferase [Clostridia bacterium]MBQ2092618.1 precorrin-3B C(17)-methyltransferase [Clostridia bacterium]MBQ3898009.1 precorrin-3B C(17)-methyltransferase [Clostridia bacterium]
MKKLSVVGIGPGSYEGMTLQAIKTIEAADVIVGYTVYCDLLKPHFPDKEFFSTPMMQEVERCRLALEKAAEGKTIAMVCSGDAGIYGMASPIIELAGEYGVEIEVIPGVTAAVSGSAVLGSPLTCDFAVISLSDLLTPMEVIEQRLEGASSGDLCIVLYNPSSKKRSDYLSHACDIILKHRSPDTVCGIVKNIGRDGEEMKLMTLAELKDYSADMFTTVFIGNSKTKIVDGKMVTPRGYVYEK